MKSILLVTQGFPFGTSERGFLPIEYYRLQEAFHLSTWSFNTEDAPLFPLSEKVSHYRYGWPKCPSLLGTLGQLKHPEVWTDLWRLIRSGGPYFFQKLCRLLIYSYRADQIIRQLREILEKEHVDIVYTYWGLQATVAAIRLKKEFPALKVISRLHNIDLYEVAPKPGWRPDSYQPLRPYLAKGCDRLIFICQEGMEYFFRHWGNQGREKGMVLYLGCTPRQRCLGKTLSQNSIKLVSCSALVPVKKVSRIIESLAVLSKEITVDWHHFGDGELREALEQQAAKELSLLPNVRYTFHGDTPNDQLDGAYASVGAELFITTSESEGLPVSMMEAYAMGLPVVATSIAGIPEMVNDGQNGYLLSADPAPSEVANAIEKYAALSENEKKALSDNAYACWQNRFNAERNVENIIALLKETGESK